MKTKALSSARINAQDPVDSPRMRRQQRTADAAAVEALSRRPPDDAAAVVKLSAGNSGKKKTGVPAGVDFTYTATTAQGRITVQSGQAYQAEASQESSASEAKSTQPPPATATREAPKTEDYGAGAGQDLLNVAQMGTAGGRDFQVRQYGSRTEIAKTAADTEA